MFLSIFKRLVILFLTIRNATYLHNRISVEVGPSQLSAAAPANEAAPSASSPQMRRQHSLRIGCHAQGGRGGRAKTTNTLEDSNRFSSFRRPLVLMFALLFTCWTQLGNAADVMQLAIYFSTFLLPSWRDFHNVFRKIIIAGFFLGLSFLESSCF